MRKRSNSEQICFSESCVSQHLRNQVIISSSEEEYMIEKFVVLIGVEVVVLDEKEIIRNGLMFSIRS